MSLKRLSAPFWIFLLGLSSPELGAQELQVYFKTTPSLESLRPFADPAEFSVLVTGADGRPLDRGSVDIRLDAPPSGALFSTDFPLVEGTRLSELRLPLQSGKTAWKQLLPIRGKYRLQVDVTTGDGRRASRSFVFTMRENESKWLALGGFSLGLFLLGFVAGRTFSGPKSIAAWVAMVVFSLVPAQSSRALNEPLEGRAILQVEPAVVGRPAWLRWSRHSDAVPLPALLTLTVEHLEKEKLVFSIDRIAVAREFSMKFHFTDGARYRVRTLAQIPGEAPLHSERVVDVAGVEPPISATVPALAFFIGLLGAGLAAGRWSRRRKGAA